MPIVGNRFTLPPLTFGQPLTQDLIGGWFGKLGGASVSDPYGYAGSPTRYSVTETDVYGNPLFDGGPAIEGFYGLSHTRGEPDPFYGFWAVDKFGNKLYEVNDDQTPKNPADVVPTITAGEALRSNYPRVKDDGTGYIVGSGKIGGEITTPTLTERYTDTQRYQEYGRTPQEVQERLVPVELFGKTVMLNERVAPMYQAWNDKVRSIEASTGLTPYAPKDIQSYNWRKIRGSDAQSLHSWGIAVDIDPSQNPQHTNKTNIPSYVYDAARQAGIKPGMDFSEKYRDPMHFEIPAGVRSGTPMSIDTIGSVVPTASVDITNDYRAARSEQFVQPSNVLNDPLGSFAASNAVIEKSRAMAEQIQRDIQLRQMADAYTDRQKLLRQEEAMQRDEGIMSLTKDANGNIVPLGSLQRPSIWDSLMQRLFGVQEAGASERPESIARDNRESTRAATRPRMIRASSKSGRKVAYHPGGVPKNAGWRPGLQQGDSGYGRSAYAQMQKAQPTEFGLHPALYESLQQVNADMAAQGLGTIKVTSGHRTDKEQRDLYKKQPQTSAPPGQSVHQLSPSPAVDIDGTPKQLSWLRDNARNYNLLPSSESWHYSIDPRVVA